MAQPRLLRSATDNMIGGVCGGIAAYLGVDSVLVRLAFILLAFASGFGFIVYLILLVIMPKEDLLNDPSSKVDHDNIKHFGSDIGQGVKRVRQHPQGPMIGASLLIAIGIYLLFQNLGWFSWLTAGIFWSLVLIGLGIYLLRRSRRSS